MFGLTAPVESLHVLSSPEYIIMFGLTAAIESLHVLSSPEYIIMFGLTAAVESLQCPACVVVTRIHYYVWSYSCCREPAMPCMCCRHQNTLLCLVLQLL